MYVEPDFVTKKALKEAIKAGNLVKVYQPGPFGGNPILDGEHSVEGPHYPKPHTWYARVQTNHERVVKVVS